MITGLTQEIASRAVERGTRPTRADREATTAFADQLFGGSANELESPNRSERLNGLKKAIRENRPGRELLDNDRRSDEDRREGRRSVERGSTKEEIGVQRSQSDVRRKSKRLDSTQTLAEDSSRYGQDTRAVNVDADVRSRYQSAKAKTEYKHSESSSTAGGPSALENRRGFEVGDRPEDRIASSTLQQKSFSPTDAETVSVVTDMQNEHLKVRQQAMQKFVVKMQDELGVPPEKLLEAFAGLDAEQLVAPPEEAMTSFLQGLSLPPVQEEQAAALYKEMVQTTGEAALNEKFLNFDAGTSFEVLSPRDRALRDLNQSIAQLNDTFFMSQQTSPMKAQLAAENMDAQLIRLAQAKSDQQDARETDSKGVGLAALTTGVVGGLGWMQAQENLSDGAAPDSLRLKMTGKGSGIEGEMDLLGLNDSESVINLNNLSSKEGSNFGDSAFADQFINQEMIDLDASRERGEQADLLQQDLLSQMATESAAVGHKGTESVAAEGALARSGASTTGLESTLGSLPTGPGQGPSSVAGATATGPAAMIINGPQPTEQDEAENIRELIKQAQVMLKKGGGEMKLEMRPEGMGQVHLKVNVENGQVHVQMLTESDATKRLIESGLNDLRSHLTAHKLQVESLSVDLGREIQKQMEHNQQEASREQARQFAQDFMGSFREDRQGFRQGMAESSGLRSYGRAQNRPAIEPDSVSSLKGASTHRTGDSRRLNLVA